jgi:ribonucrease Y
MLYNCSCFFLAGGLITYYIYRILLKKKRLNMINEAELEAEVIRKEKILQAKEKFYQLKSEHEKLINEKNNKINQIENKIKQRERHFPSE